MCDNDFQCETKDCFYCLQQDITGEIFRTIESEQEGEVDSVWYQKKLDEYRYQELGDYFGNMDDEECEKHIYEYGFHKAFTYYTERYGKLEVCDGVNVCKTLLYAIVDDELYVSYDDYKDWCEEHCDCDD